MSSKQINKRNEEWLNELEHEILACLVAKQNINLDLLASKMFVSKRQLQRKVKEITEGTAYVFVKNLKLGYAKQLLEKGVFKNVLEVSLECGFTDSHYFSICFKKKFGKMPISYFVGRG